MFQIIAENFGMNHVSYENNIKYIIVNVQWSNGYFSN